MADRPTQVPEWATDPGADVVEPPEAKKEIGWQQGEKPPAGFFNWLFAQLTRWIAWFAQEIKERTEGGISVPGGVESPSVQANLVLASQISSSFVATAGVGEEPGLWATGGPNAPAVIGVGKAGQSGGRFEGTFGVRAETYGNSSAAGHAAAVEAWVLSEADGLALHCKPSTNPLPLRGAILIEPSNEPSQPARGEIYIDAQSNRLRWWDGAAWVDISIDSEESARHVVGAPGEPALEPGWIDGPAPRYPPSFYRDGRRVWLDGNIQHSASAGDLAFVLPVGFRPAAPVIFDYPVNFAGGALRIQPDGSVEVFGVGSNVANVSLAGLSFEVAP